MLIGRYTAVLDACVLHPVFVRGVLLWFAAERLFRPLWSAAIWTEWERSLQRKHPDVTPEQLQAQRQKMETAFDEAMVVGFDSLINSLTLPDPDDRHVLAAAIVGRADAIVTANLKDFPEAATSPFNIEAIHPDDFIVNAINLDPARALTAFRRHREALSTTSPTPVEYLERFERCGLGSRLIHSQKATAAASATADR